MRQSRNEQPCEQHNHYRYKNETPFRFSLPKQICARKNFNKNTQCAQNNQPTRYPAVDRPKPRENQNQRWSPPPIFFPVLRLYGSETRNNFAFSRNQLCKTKAPTLHWTIGDMTGEILERPMRRAGSIAVKMLQCHPHFTGIISIVGRFSIPDFRKVNLHQHIFFEQKLKPVFLILQNKAFVLRKSDEFHIAFTHFTCRHSRFYGNGAEIKLSSLSINIHFFASESSVLTTSALI